MSTRRETRYKNPDGPVAPGSRTLDPVMRHGAGRVRSMGWRTLTVTLLCLSVAGATAADLYNYQVTPLKAPDCVSDLSTALFEENIPQAVPPHPTLPVSNFYLIVRYMGDDAISSSPSYDFGHIDVSYPWPPYRGLALTGLTVPDPTAQWQRAKRSDANPDNSSAFQIHCYDAASYINTWMFPFQTLVGGGPHAIYGYSFNDPPPPAIFDDNPATDFVPRLWATRRVGFLLDEIRIHGETNELRDEATELARKYGIVTPYTAYLIVEDEERRDVPAASRSLQSMSSDTAARDNAAKAWAGFKDKKEGDDGVANARSQNFFKYAEQAGASIASGASESSRGLVAAAPGARAESKRITRYTQQSKFVNGRNFFQNGKQWVDTSAQKTTKRQRVQFNSDDYFDLLKKHPEAAPWMALGQNVLLALDDTVYEITD